MPLRANVEHEPAPTPDLKPGTEVWACRFTGEIFERYSDYIAAIALYRQRIWTCEFTGKQSLTFEEALDANVSSAVSSVGPAGEQTLVIGNYEQK